MVERKIECGLLTIGYGEKPNSVTLEKLRRHNIPNLERLTTEDLRLYRTIGKCVLAAVRSGKDTCQYFQGIPELTYQERKAEHGYGRQGKMPDQGDKTDYCPIPKYVREALR